MRRTIPGDQFFATAVAIGLLPQVTSGVAGASTAQAKSPGPGTLTVSPTSVGTTTMGNDLTFTFTAPSTGFDSGELVIAIPRSWSVPQTASPTAPGYLTSQAGTIQITGSKVSWPTGSSTPAVRR